MVGANLNEISRFSLSSFSLRENEPDFQLHGIAPTLNLDVESGLVVQLGLMFNVSPVFVDIVLRCPLPLPSVI